MGRDGIQKGRNAGRRQGSASETDAVGWHCFLCGAVDVEGWHECPSCGGMCNFIPEETYQRLEGRVSLFDGDCNGPAFCNVVPDKMAKHYDDCVGATITSRSQKKRLYAENDLIMISAKDHYRGKDKPRIHSKAYSFAGQKDHQSSSERDGVRAKDGQRIL